MLMCKNKYVYRSIVKIVLNSNFYKVTSDYIFFNVLVDILYVYEDSTNNVNNETYESVEIYINMLRTIYDLYSHQWCCTRFASFKKISK